MTYLDSFFNFIVFLYSYCNCNLFSLQDTFQNVEYLFTLTDNIQIFRLLLLHGKAGKKRGSLLQLGIFSPLAERAFRGCQRGCRGCHREAAEKGTPAEAEEEEEDAVAGRIQRRRRLADTHSAHRVRRGAPLGSM